MVKQDSEDVGSVGPIANDNQDDACMPKHCMINHPMPEAIQPTQGQFAALACLSPYSLSIFHSKGLFIFSISQKSFFPFQVFSYGAQQASKHVHAVSFTMCYFLLMEKKKPRLNYHGQENKRLCLRLQLKITRSERSSESQAEVSSKLKTECLLFQALTDKPEKSTNTKINEEMINSEEQRNLSERQKKIIWKILLRNF